MGRSKHRMPRRSARGWGIRAVLAIVVAILGYAEVARTLGYTLRTRNIEHAHDLAPGDGRITALLAQKLSGPDAKAADRARGDTIAKRALQQDPTAVAAVSTLGLNAQVRGDGASARRYFAYADRLSRRDLPAQLWWIENAVAQGDLANALHHYDIALRTSLLAPDLLFPILGSALAEPVVRTALIRTLATRPNWGTAFVQYASTQGADPRASAILFERMIETGQTVPPDSRVALVGRLIASGFPDAAWTLYVIGHRKADRRASRDPAFASDPAEATPFDWTPVNDSSIAASIQRSEHGGLVDLAVPTSIGGPMLQQMQLLPPGDYRLVGHSIGIDQQKRSSPYWELNCSDGRQLGRVSMPNSAQAGGVFTGQFTVPMGCPVQILRLLARPSDAVTGLTGQIDRVRLAPAH